MTLPYSLRLLCLCLEVLFLVNLVACPLVLVLARALGRTAHRMHPQVAARWFLGMRLFPFGLGLLLIATLCLPSYLRYEQNSGSEAMGTLCIAAGVMGCGLVLTVLVRAALVLAELWRISRLGREHLPLHTQRVGEIEVCVAGPGDRAPWMALVGIVRPRFVVSRPLLHALTAEQMEAALQHERAHQLSHDNLKRLLLALVPGMLPGMPPSALGMRALHAQWERFAELAADDYATRGDLDRSIALAETLVKVARLGSFAHALPLASSLSAHEAELGTRVHRLLHARETGLDPAPSGHRSRYLYLLCALAALLVLLPRLFYPLYGLLESLLH